MLAVVFTLLYMCRMVLRSGKQSSDRELDAIDWRTILCLHSPSHILCIYRVTKSLSSKVNNN